MKITKTNNDTLFRLRPFQEVRKKSKKIGEIKWGELIDIMVVRSSENSLLANLMRCMRTLMT